MDEIAESILKEVRRVGYVVSAHAMGEYVEMHAVNPAMPDEVKIARIAVTEEVDDDAAHRQCAVALAEMVNTSTPDRELQQILDGNPTPKQIGDEQFAYLQRHLIDERHGDSRKDFHAEIEGEDVTAMIRDAVQWPEGVEGLGDYMKRLHGDDRIDMFELGEGMMKFNEVIRDARMYMADMLFENVVHKMAERGHTKDAVQRVFSPNHIRRWMYAIDDE